MSSVILAILLLASPSPREKLEARSWYVTSAFFQNPDGLFIKLGKAVPGIIWGDLYVSGEGHTEVMAKYM